MGREEGFLTKLIAGITVLCFSAQSFAFVLPPIPPKNQPIVMDPTDNADKPSVSKDTTAPPAPIANPPNTSNLQLTNPPPHLQAEPSAPADPQSEAPEAPQGPVGLLNKDIALVPIDQAVLKTDKNFSGVVLVAQNSNILFEQGYKDLPAKDMPYSPTTQFLLASITKQFTAAMVMQEVHLGHLRLDDSIVYYIPNAPKSWEPITVKNLLTHTSGILKDYLYDSKYFESEEDILKSIVSKRTFSRKLHMFQLSYNPDPRYLDKRFYYNNTNYFLLGIILENLNPGRKLSALVRERITVPLGMNSSGMIPPWKKSASRLYSPDGEPEAAQPAKYFAVGNMVSSAEDLFLWNNAIFEDPTRLKLDKEETAEMTSAKESTEHDYGSFDIPEDQRTYKTVVKRGRTVNVVESPKTEYGYGFRISQINGKHIVWHTGHLTNHTALIVRYVEDNLTIIILTNKTWYPVFSMANNIIQAVFNVPKVPPPGRERAALKKVNRLAQNPSTQTHKKRKKKALVANNHDRPTSGL